MKCPYCGKDMEDGYIYNFDRTIGVIWYPKGKLPGHFITAKSIKKKGGMALSSYSLRRGGSKLSSSICKSCNIGIYNIEKNAVIDFVSDWFTNESY